MQARRHAAHVIRRPREPRKLCTRRTHSMNAVFPHIPSMGLLFFLGTSSLTPHTSHPTSRPPARIYICTLTYIYTQNQHLHLHLHLDLHPGCRFWRCFRAPERPRWRCLNHCLPMLCCDFGAPQTSPSRMSVLAVFPSPREATQEVLESLPRNAILRFQCSPGVSLQDVGSGGVSEPQRGHALGI